jgi:polysaccharide export outer membrane protein
MRLTTILSVIVASACLAACGASLAIDGEPNSMTLSAQPASTLSPESGIPDAQAPDPEATTQLRKVVKNALSGNDQGSSAYRIGPQDVLNITVFKVQDLTKTVQVSEAGTINYPLIGETNVSGETARQLEQKLTRILGAKYLQNPQVSVVISQHNSQRVTIEGAVGTPGIYPLKGGMTLLQLVASAQGLKPTAEDDAVILRKISGKRSAARFSMSELRGGTIKDPQLNAGDVVIVNMSVTKQAFSLVLKSIPLFLLF